MPISTKELMQKAGIGSAQTLRAYRRAGLVTPINVQEGEETRGRTILWPESTVKKLLQIRSLQRDGLTLEEIAKVLKHRRRPSRRSLFDAKPEVAVCCQKIVTEIKRNARFIRDAPSKELLKAKHWNRAGLLARSGSVPLLIIRTNAVTIVSDEELSQLLNESGGGPQMVMSLRQFFEEELQQASAKPQSADSGAPLGNRTRHLDID